MDLSTFENYRLAAGAEKARLHNQIVIAEAPLVRGCVRSVMRKYRSAGEVEDLNQHGMMGLAKAVTVWDPAKGAWTPFARKWVTDAIQQALPAQSLIRVNKNRAKNRCPLTREQVKDVQAIRSSGREPTAEDVNVAKEVFDRWRAPVAQAVSDGGTCAEQYCQETPSPDSRTDAITALSVLTPQQQRIILGLFVEEKTLDEVGAAEGHSKFWAFEQRDIALKAMRERLR